MKTKLLLSLIAAAGVFIVHADDEKLPLLKAGSDTYTNVTVTSVSATDIYFIHAGGTANVKLKSLSPELQKHFHFDPKKAGAAELKQAENKVKYQQQLQREPVVKAPDMSREPSAPAAAGSKAVWRTDYPGALKQAKAEGKLVLLDFTGSDWCGWCIKFDQDVLSTPKFATYAAAKLQLVKVDFPRRTPQPEGLRRANEALGRQFSVDGFPTFVLVTGDGRELWRQSGYLKGGPDAFIAALEKAGR